MTSNAVTPSPIREKSWSVPACLQTVVLNNVPDYRYQYVYVNDTPVLVDPVTRRIVYVFQ